MILTSTLKSAITNKINCSIPASTRLMLRQTNMMKLGCNTSRRHHCTEDLEFPVDPSGLSDVASLASHNKNQ